MNQTTLLKWESHHQSVIQNMYCYYINQEMVDVTLLLKDGEIKAHRIVLCAGSKYIESVLNTHEQGQCRVFENTPKEIMSYLIEFFYKGQVAVPNSILRKVKDAATFYKVRGFMVSEEFSSCQSLESSEQEPPTGEKENVSLPLYSSLERNTKLIISTPGVKSTFKKHSGGIKVTQNSETINDNCRAQFFFRDTLNTIAKRMHQDMVRSSNFDFFHSSDNEIIFFVPKGSAQKHTTPERLGDSDETNIGKTQKPNSNKHQQVSPEVEIDDTVNSTVLSPDQCQDVPTTSNEQNPVRTRIEPFVSTDDEQDEPVSKKPKIKVSPFTRIEIFTKPKNKKENCTQVGGDEVKKSHAKPCGNNASKNGSIQEDATADRLDETNIDESPKPGTSVQPLNPNEDQQASTEVEIVDKDDVIVISDTSPPPSPDLCRDVPTTSKEQNPVRNRFAAFVSTDEEQDEFVPKSPPRKRILAKAKKKSLCATLGAQARKVSRKKIEKYEQLLFANSNNFAKLDQFCVVCFKFYRNVKIHLKDHKTMTLKNKPKCKQCGRVFYRKCFLENENHNCVK